LVLRIVILFLTSDNKKNMKTFNEKLTIEQATELFKFKGATMFPKTQHNLKIMALVIDNHLKKLR